MRNVQIVPGSTIIHDGWKYYAKTQVPYNKKDEARWGTFKPAEEGALFNLKDDIGETTDVSGQYPEVAESLKKKMEAFMAEFETTTRPVGNASDHPDKNFILDRSEVNPGESMGSKRNRRKEKKEE